jgi:hypothetical protein
VPIEKRIESLIMSIKKILKNTKGFRSVSSLFVFQYALIYNASHEYSGMDAPRTVPAGAITIIQFLHRL